MPAIRKPSVLDGLHPVVAEWFQTSVGEPTEPQERGWPLIRSGRDALIAAPTGSGKTLTAFLGALNGLFERAVRGELTDETTVLYVSPLKALGNDIQKNLLDPLSGIEALARAKGLDPQQIRVSVRSGDTPAKERAAMLRKPPHVLITTPESLYLGVTAGKSRENLRSVRTVIVDELHAIARDKRGSHLALTLERLKALAGGPIQLVGLSATMEPIAGLATFLVGNHRKPCEILKIGHVRPWELSVAIPDDELSAVATNGQWGQVYDRLVELAGQHRTMLVFTNTRRLAERMAHDLGLRMGPGVVSAHHGSMAKEARLRAEERLKRGELRVMVATASLELGIDIGSIDLVVQIGSSRSIGTMLQRIGRAGHHKAGISKGVVVALTRDELVEAAALLRAVREKRLDPVIIPEKPLDILAQQVVAACGADDWDETALFELVRGAAPYGALTRAEFDDVVRMLSEGVSTLRGRSRVHLHRDAVNGVLKGRRGARQTALMNGGAIPDTFAYQVVAEADGKVVGSLDEDFAIESVAGDVFSLGSSSWRIRRVSQGKVHVEDAAGEAPTIPFWLGEAPSRTLELSAEVARLRRDIISKEYDREALILLGLPSSAADQLLRYVRAGVAALGAVPDGNTVIAERFFDDAGGMQLVIHAPFGARVNRAWGLALRKRFCRSFDFELQAAATDDGLLLSLSEQHSFPLEDIFRFVPSKVAEETLVQAVLQIPLFGTRFRWNATRSLVLQRNDTRGRVAPILQRARAEDLLASVFPAQVACQDNMGGGDIELPVHPLVTSTMHDCLREAMDVDRLVDALKAIESGRIVTRSVDVAEPSPFAHALLNSAPYTFLDGAPLEERRARAVSTRRTLPAGEAVLFGALDAKAIARVIEEAAPPLRDADELHDALLSLGILSLDVLSNEYQESLVSRGRAFTVGGRFLAATERRRLVEAAHPALARRPDVAPLPDERQVTREEALLSIVRGHAEICGPVTTAELAAQLGFDAGDVEIAFAQLESLGTVLRGRFRDGATDNEWCDRRLLQRIHRLTVGRLRAEIQPVVPAVFMRFLFRWHRLDKREAKRGRHAVVSAAELLEGWEAPASAWEHGLLDARVEGFDGEDLARACLGGELAWGRLSLRAPSAPPGPARGAGQVTPKSLANRSAQITFARRSNLGWLLGAVRGAAPPSFDCSDAATKVIDALREHGALFFADLVNATRLLPAQLEDALWELLALGAVTADDVQNLRVLLSPQWKKRSAETGRGGPGRWALLRGVDPTTAEERSERVAMLLLRRYGVVWRDLAIREAVCPSWRELLTTLRRLEARGLVRGGRFVSGFAGEQFALPDAVDLLRALRREAPSEQPVRVAAVDPLNLTGIVTPGPRVPAMPGSDIYYVNGIPLDGAPPLSTEASPSPSTGRQRKPRPQRHPFARPG